MLRNFALTLFVVLGTISPAASVMAKLDCSLLDPRAQVSSEREGKIQASVNTLFKIGKAGGSVEGKMKDEIQNLQKGAPVTEQGLIKLRTLYLFCGMVADAEDISTERKVELFNIMMGAKTADKPESKPTPTKKKPKASRPSQTIATNPKDRERVTAPPSAPQPNPQTSISIASQGQSGGITAQNVTVIDGTAVDPSHPLTVSPSSRQISPGMSQVFMLKVTNHIDKPLYQLQLRIRVDEGDLSSDAIKFESQEKSKITSDIGGLVMSHDIFAIVGYDSEGKEQILEFIYDIGSKSEKEFLINVNGNKFKKPSKVSFEIVHYLTEPPQIVSWKEKIQPCNEKDDFESAHDKGRRFLNNRAFKEAINCLQKAVKLNPGVAKARTNLGVAYYALGDNDSAIAAWEKAIESDPRLPQPQFDIGIMLMDNNRYEEAIKWFEKTSKLDHVPIKQESLVMWGVCLKKLKQQEKAFEKYQLAIDSDSKYSHAYLQWGLDLLEQEQYIQAINKFRTAFEISDGPNRLDALGFWGDTLAKMGKKNEAIAKYGEIVDLAPKSEQANRARNATRRLTEKRIEMN